MDTVDFLRTYTYGDLFELYKDYTWLQPFLDGLVKHKDVELSFQEFEAWIKLCNLGIKYTETHNKEDELRMLEEAVKHLYSTSDPSVSGDRYKVIEND